jgi:hypothetical protein
MIDLIGMFVAMEVVICLFSGGHRSQRQAARAARHPVHGNDRQLKNKPQPTRLKKNSVVYLTNA